MSGTCCGESGEMVQRVNHPWFWCLPFQIKVEFSMKFTSRDMSLKRTPSKKQTGVFGVKISVVTKYVGRENLVGEALC